MSHRIPTPALCRGAVAALALVATTALADGRDRDRIEARLKSFQEVPAVSSAASGRFKAHVDKASMSLSYELSYSGLEGEVRMAHIHLGQHGVNGGIMVWLCQTLANPSPVATTPACPQSGTVAGVVGAADVIGPAGQGIAAAEFAEMLAAIRGGVAYVNVHSAKFPGGEIRGQLRDDD
jgi:CHRD domain